MSQGQNKKVFEEKLEDFLCSDTVSATAAKFLLAGVAIGGVIFVGAVAPGLASAFGKKKYSRRYDKDQLRNSFYSLKRQKLIEITKEGEKFEVRLTNKGKNRIKEFSLETLAIKKPKHWDKKWRVLIFDIPTKPKIYNQARNALREKIKKLGFVQIQKSVWVCPYECEDEILFVAELFHVQKYIEIITAEKLLHENIIKAKLKL